ncbi:MAG: alpha/beta hydrolase [Oceanospirillales bacterium]|nr:MAG: alpha/beta hydrolase [Oceanospirillales bacterium]
MSIVTRTETLVIDTPEGNRNIAWQMWQHPDKPDAPLVICVHGLTRNRHDFDMLAKVLAEDYRVITVDVIGRGDSDRLHDGQLYGYPLYVSQMMQLLEYLEEETGQSTCYWVGTSMGGLIGMMIAALPNSPINRLILNDIGPVIPLAALQRLGEYVGKAPTFHNIVGIEHYLRIVAQPFGPLTDAQWQHLARYSAEDTGGGVWQLRYDPQIALAFAGLDSDIDLTAVWTAVECPVLVIRGAESDLLTANTANDMLMREGTELAVIPGVGHAPVLMDDEQISLVSEFFNR